MALDTPPHILFLIVPILAISVVWLIYAFLICPLLISPLFDGSCVLVSGLSLLLLAVVVYLEWVNNRLVVTNLKVTRQRGIIGKTIVEIELNQIQDIKISFGILGRIFGFGTIEIESAGTFGKVVFQGIPSPESVKNKVEKEVHKIRKQCRQ